MLLDRERIPTQPLEHDAACLGRAASSPALAQSLRFFRENEMQGNRVVKFLCVCACPTLGKRGVVTLKVPQLRVSHLTEL